MDEGIPDYDELRLRIAPGLGGVYQVVASAASGATASGTLSLPINEMELDNFVLRVGLPRRGTRAYRSSQMEEAKHFGSQLFDALINSEVRDVYLAARRAAELRDRGLRVTLYLTDVPELMEIPWEFLYERPSFLSQSIYTPLVRSLDFKTVRPPHKVHLPLRILGIVSRPQGFESLDTDREQEKLREALSGLLADRSVELRWLDHATLTALDEAISEPGEVHIVHYIGHGAYDKRAENGILILEDYQGNPHEVTGEELGALLQDEHSLRLVVLNACEGARCSHVDPFSGVASSLLERGIPAVIGMQFEITDEAAITFASRFYRAIAQGYSADAAIAQARKAIFAAGNDTEFGTPVLFLRGPESRIFDVVPPKSESSTQAAPGESQKGPVPEPQGKLRTYWTTGAREVARLDHPRIGTFGMGLRQDVEAVAFSPDGSRIVTAGSTATAHGTAQVWDVASGRKLSTITVDAFGLKLGETPSCEDVAFSPNGRQIATASSGDIAQVWENGREVVRVSHNNRQPDLGSSIFAVAFSPDGNRIATASGDGTSRVWDVADGREVARVSHASVHDVVFSPDGGRIATAGGDGTTRVWDIQSGRELMRVAASAQGVAFSPDGTRIATAESPAKTARVWDARTGKELARVTHDVKRMFMLAGVEAVTFSPDGTLIATACMDKTARVWDARTGEELTRVTHGNWVYDVVFSPNGRQIATASKDGTARVWEAGR